MKQEQKNKKQEEKKRITQPYLDNLLFIWK